MVPISPSSKQRYGIIRYYAIPTTIFFIVLAKIIAVIDVKAPPGKGGAFFCVETQDDVRTRGRGCPKLAGGIDVGWKVGLRKETRNEACKPSEATRQETKANRLMITFRCHQWVRFTVTSSTERSVVFTA